MLNRHSNKLFVILLVLASVWIVSTAWAAPVAVGDTSSDENDGSSLSVNHVVAAGEGLLVFVTLANTDANAEVESVDWNTVTLL